MSDVIVTMREVHHSLSHWRAAIREGVAGGEKGRTLTQSLLVPLSCLVLLRLSTQVRVRCARMCVVVMRLEVGVVPYYACKG